jgi:uncharacterized protein YkwD
MRITRRPAPFLPAVALLALMPGSLAGCSSAPPVTVAAARPSGEVVAVGSPTATPADAPSGPANGPTQRPAPPTSPTATGASAWTRAEDARRAATRTLTPQALTAPKLTLLPTSPLGAQPRTDSTTSHPDTAQTATTAAAGKAGTWGEESEVLRLTNLERAKAGCPALTRNATLSGVARAHSRDMAVRRYFTHDSLDGRTPFERMTAAGYRYRDAAENIAAGQPSAADVVRDWMLSPGHRENIVDCGLRELGIGLYISGSSTYTYYWTQDFGTPRSR